MVDLCTTTTPLYNEPG